MARGPEYAYVERPSMELLSELGWIPVDAFHENRLFLIDGAWNRFLRPQDVGVSKIAG